VEEEEEEGELSSRSPPRRLRAQLESSQKNSGAQGIMMMMTPARTHIITIYDED
jgi:hypothetical protein